VPAEKRLCRGPRLPSSSCGAKREDAFDLALFTEAAPRKPSRMVVEDAHRGSRVPAAQRSVGLREELQLFVERSLRTPDG
jgi:hypothetical protein